MAPHLAELLGVPHVASGELLRATVTRGDPFRIADRLGGGRLVPDPVVVQVVADALGEGFILDGCPRNVRQAAELDRLLEPTGRRIQLVLELIVPDEVASARLSRLSRMESRSDDSPDTVAARLVAYRRDAPALLAHYARRVRRVIATGDVDEVCRRAERALESLPREASS